LGERILHSKRGVGWEIAAIGQNIVHMLSNVQRRMWDCTYWTEHGVSNQIYYRCKEMRPVWGAGGEGLDLFKGRGRGMVSIG